MTRKITMPWWDRERKLTIRGWSRFCRRRLVAIAGGSEGKPIGDWVDRYFPDCTLTVRIPRSLRARYRQWVADGGDIPF